MPESAFDKAVAKEFGEGFDPNNCSLASSRRYTMFKVGFNAALDAVKAAAIPVVVHMVPNHPDDSWRLDNKVIEFLRQQ